MKRNKLLKYSTRMNFKFIMLSGRGQTQKGMYYTILFIWHILEKAKSPGQIGAVATRDKRGEKRADDKGHGKFPL